MSVEISWHSKQGRRADTNQDYCGIGVRRDTTLCVVLDGSTTGKQSGELVRLIASDLIDWFTNTNGRITADDIINQLREIHNARSSELHWASASYLVAMIEAKKPTLILYVGDCLVGRFNTNAPIEWLIRPHTLVNAIESMSVEEIASFTLRNKLTRSFRAKEFMIPDIASLTASGEETFVIATDGFWAELKHEEQLRFLEGEGLQLEDDMDDCSALKIHILDSTAKLQVNTSTAENFYVMQSD